MSEITHETSALSELKHGKTPVGLEATPLAAASKLDRGLLILADDSNTSTVFIGSRSALMSGGPLAGWPLKPGASLRMPVDNVEVWCIANDTDNVVHWMGV